MTRTYSEATVKQVISALEGLAAVIEGDLSRDWSELYGADYDAYKAALALLSAPDATEGHSLKDGYWIWSGEWTAWWRPKQCGYTYDLSEAGVYTKAEAEHILAGCGPEKRLEMKPALPQPPQALATPKGCKGHGPLGIPCDNPNCATPKAPATCEACKMEADPNVAGYMPLPEHTCHGKQATSVEE